jgi:hypothetical protein
MALNFKEFSAIREPKAGRRRCRGSRRRIGKPGAAELDGSIVVAAG